MLRSRLLLTLLILSLGGLSVGCDSRAPVTAPSPEDVWGVYEFTEYRFVPAAPAIAPIDMLEAFVLANTNLELLAPNRVLLRYRFQDGGRGSAEGRFDTNVRQQVRIQFTDPSELVPVLLTSPLVFERPTEDQLALEAPLTVNLAAFDPERYRGLTEIQGRLVLELQRTDS